MEQLEQYLERHKIIGEKSEDFVTYLYTLMDKYYIEKASSVYGKANITKQAWSQMISSKCNPSLNTCLKIVFSMRLTNHECKYLLKKAGYTLASSSTFSLIIRYCIENKVYDLFSVNEKLKKFGFDIIY